MRSKILNQIKYQKNAGTAFDRTGFNTVIAIAIGGSSSTAIKLQTCDTSDGVFEDVVTLVASADAGSRLQGQQRLLSFLVTQSKTLTKNGGKYEKSSN